MSADASDSSLAEPPEEAEESLARFASELVAALLVPLAGFRESLPRGLNKDEAKLRLRRRVQELGFEKYGGLTQEQAQEVLRTSVKTFLTETVRVRFEGREGVTVGEWLDGSARVFAWDELLLAFLEGGAEEGQGKLHPAAGRFLRGGAVLKVVPVFGEKLPIVFGWATGYSARKTAVGAFDRLVGKLTEQVDMSPPTLVEAARFLRLKLGRGDRVLKNREVATRMVEEEFSGRAEWEDEELREVEVRGRMETIRQRLFKLTHSVARIEKFAKRNSG